MFFSFLLKHRLRDDSNVDPQSLCHRVFTKAEIQEKSETSLLKILQNWHGLMILHVDN